MKMKLLFQDQHITVAVKPEGLLSKSDERGRESMVSLLEELTKGPIFPVHRLDRETVGVMVTAKTQLAAARLSQQIRERSFQKEYLAVLTKAPSEPAGEYADLLFRDAAGNKSFVVDRERKGVKKAVLSYRLLETKNGLSLVEIRPETGRTHQIRVQFASRNTPLLGDRKYGGAPSESLALFARKISFFHPADGKQVSFSAAPDAKFPWSLFEIENEGL